MIIDRNYDYYEDERLYSTGINELDEILERAFCEGYEYAQREYAEKEEKKSKTDNHRGLGRSYYLAGVPGVAGRVAGRSTEKKMIKKGKSEEEAEVKGRKVASATGAGAAAGTAAAALGTIGLTARKAIKENPYLKKEIAEYKNQIKERIIDSAKMGESEEQIRKNVEKGLKRAKRAGKIGLAAGTAGLIGTAALHGSLGAAAGYDKYTSKKREKALKAKKNDKKGK